MIFTANCGERRDGGAGPLEDVNDVVCDDRRSKPPRSTWHRPRRLQRLSENTAIEAGGFEVGKQVQEKSPYTGLLWSTICVPCYGNKH